VGLPEAKRAPAERDKSQARDGRIKPAQRYGCVRAASDVVAANAVNVLHSGDLELDLGPANSHPARQDHRSASERIPVARIPGAQRKPSGDRTMILEHIWNSSFEGLTSVVDVSISTLRNKVDRDFPRKLIQINRGIGYTFTCIIDFPPTSQVRAS
jgi:DNA-binding response OmpR family regulator